MSDSLRFLRRKIAAIEGHALTRVKEKQTYAPTGCEPIDRALGGGFLRGRVHEIFADQGEAGSGVGFTGILTRRLGGELLWLREGTAERQVGCLYAAGLVEIGIDPARLTLAVLPDAVAVLRAAADALRSSALGSTVMELAGDPRSWNLTASRRLALAAEASGNTALILRIEGHMAPSAAQTRWRVMAAPSSPLAANAPGHPAWDIELLRQRGRSEFGRWRIEWNRDNAELRDQAAEDTALSGAVVSLPGDRPVYPFDPVGIRRVG